MNWEIITFIAYFAILLGVALVFYFNGTNKNSEDFFLGGRSMGPWVTALSCLLYTSPSPRDRTRSRMPSSA